MPTGVLTMLNVSEGMVCGEVVAGIPVNFATIRVLRYFRCASNLEVRTVSPPVSR